jgi:hypothetical protein
MLHAGLKAGALFMASLLALYILLKTLLPPIDEEHKDRVKLPKTFEELKGLNEVLQVSCAGLERSFKTKQEASAEKRRCRSAPRADFLRSPLSRQVYKTRHYYRVLGCYTTVYLL